MWIPLERGLRVCSLSHHTRPSPSHPSQYSRYHELSERIRAKPDPATVLVRLPTSKSGSTITHQQERSVWTATIIHAIAAQSGVTPPPTTRGVAEGLRPRSDSVDTKSGSDPLIDSRTDSRTGSVVCRDGNSRENDHDDSHNGAGDGDVMPPPPHERHPASPRAPASQLAAPLDSGVSAIAFAALSSPSAAALLGGAQHKP